jgi:molybdopterin-containing oxidoreductase family iron-sulfur binding subunit
LKAEKIKHMVDLLTHAKAAVVLPAESFALGKASVTHHVAVFLLNKALGGVGKFYNFEAGLAIDRVPNHQGVADLIKDLNGGGVDLLLIHGANPAYSLPAAAGFEAAMGKAAYSIAFVDRMDETAALADLVVPVTHDLESWGEVNTYVGMDMLMQPAMTPRWECPQAEDLLLSHQAGGESFYRDALKASWNARFGGDETSWRKDLQRGGRFELPAGTDLPVSGNLDDAYFQDYKTHR